MSIEKESERINAFIRSKECIFLLSQIDFPSQTQQRCIQSFLLVNRILVEKDPLRQFQQLCFKNTTNQRNIVIGLFYYSLLHSQQQETMFGYVRQLNSQSLEFLADYLIQFIACEFDKVNDEGILTLPAIYYQLMRYNILVQKLTVQMLRTINYIDLSERGLTYASSLIDAFLETVQIIDLQGIGRLLFAKVLRVLTAVVLIQDEGVVDFRNKCGDLLSRVWNLDKSQCISSGKEMFRYFQQLVVIEQLRDLSREYQEAYYAQQRTVMAPRSRTDELLAINMPIQIFDIITFSLSTDYNQILCQLSWLEKRNKQNRNYEMVLVDILRYMARIVSHNNRFIYLQWIFEYCFSKRATPVCLSLCQQALFFDWFFLQDFQEKNLEELTIAGLSVLNAYLFANTDRCQQMLEFVLYHSKASQNPSKTKGNLRKIFKMSEQRGPLKYSQILGNARIDIRIKTELKSIMSQQKIETKDYNTTLTRMQSGQSDNIWGHQVYVQPQLQSSQMQSQNEHNSAPYITFEKLFYQKCKAPINLITQAPTTQNYILFLDQIFPIIKKTFGDTDTCEKFISESVKAVYILFQSHFECFWKVPLQSNITRVHVDYLMDMWKISDMNLQIHKKMIKGLSKYFPICKYAINFVFLMSVPSTRVHCYQVCTFLQNKQKSQIETVMSKLIPDQTLVAVLRMKAVKFKIVIK